ncbi:MAG: hypothetical protein HOQ07_08880 [Sinomonas sp.]|nr:hypothetical protein [Sinomonas sp.]
MDIQSWAPVAAVAVSVVALVRGEALRRRLKPEETRRDAAERIGDALGVIHELIEHADVEPPSRHEVGSALRQFETEWRRLGRRLPRGAWHLGRSIREATANLFGSSAALEYLGSEDREPEPLHPYWWDISLTYIEHVQASLSRWLVDERRRPLMPMPYDQWRRDEDPGSNR